MFFMHSIFVFPNGEAIIQNLSAENIRSQRKAIKNHFFCNIVAVSIFSINVILLHSMTQLLFLFYFPCDFEALLGLQVSLTGGSLRPVYANFVWIVDFVQKEVYQDLKNLQIHNPPCISTNNHALNILQHVVFNRLIVLHSQTSDFQLTTKA